MNHKAKAIFAILIIIITLCLIYIFESQKLGKLRLIFCDIGQGDGILIVTPSGKQLVIDAGPGIEIADCLGKNMHFWDRKIETMFLTHVQQDHMEGQIEVFKQFKVDKVLWNGVENNTQVFSEWKNSLSAEGSKVTIAQFGQTLKDGSVYFDVLWPTPNKIYQWKQTPPKDLNDGSVIVKLRYGGFCAYLTGDIPKEILAGVINGECQVLKVSHHGSKTGTSTLALDKIKPKIAVVQVGKNSFGHPHREVLNLLSNYNVKVFRNDKDGTVEIDSDGRSYKTNSPSPKI